MSAVDFASALRRRMPTARRRCGLDRNGRGAADPGAEHHRRPSDKAAGPFDVDQISSPARLAVDEQHATPSVITRSTHVITLRFHVIACDGQTVRGALVYATPTPYQQFTGVERPTGPDGWATLRMTRLRFFPATPQQQNLIVFIRPSRARTSWAGSRRAASSGSGFASEPPCLTPTTSTP